MEELGLGFVVAITGASGAVYGRRLVQLLAEAGQDVHLVISPHGAQVMREELSIGEPTADAFTKSAANRVSMYAYDDVGCELASGSFHTDGMVVCPCSSNTLAGIANGLADNLITRAAAVTLKERRRLVLCPREMPLSPIDVANMHRASQAGVVVCPASPAFYMSPASVEELVDSVAGKLLDLIGVEHRLRTRWAQQLAERHQHRPPRAPRRVPE
mgnify:CR=1 FL=1